MSEETQKEAPDYPFCINCSFIGTNPSREWERFRCFAEKNIRSRRKNPVTGNEEVFFIFESCLQARETPLEKGGCGMEASWFKEREKLPERPTAETIDIDDLLEDDIVP